LHIGPVGLIAQALARTRTVDPFLTMEPCCRPVTAWVPVLTGDFAILGGIGSSGAAASVPPEFRESRVSDLPSQRISAIDVLGGPRI
jgi:hypothetical protein